MLLDSYYEERQPLGKQVVDHAFTTLQNFALMPQALGFYHGQSQKEGFAKLQKLLSDVAGAEERRARLAEVIELQNRRSHALGLQLGQQYASVAVVQDGTSFPKHTRNAVLYYEPTTHPGEYLLNSRLKYRGQRISLLDELQHGEFGLLVGIGGDPWEAAVKAVSNEVGVKLPVYKLGYCCPYDDILNE
ncbi:hypothetical protein FOMG_02461 [Fusarium oxysporum f. sp. melonis 26406]|nr:hypothetical protein FOMG_02461 [Fusarium oxysporum f. sp. melonis 26406]